MLKLYYAPNTCALASHIALEEAGADYEAVRVDFRNEEQKTPDYLAVNPKARVPALVTDRGVLSETPALLVYIAQSFPAAGLAPLDDHFALAGVQAFNNYLCATVHVAHAHNRRGSRWVDDEAAVQAMQAKVPQAMRECFELIESEMIAGPWVLGDDYSICDPYLFTLTRWLEGDQVDRADFPKVAAHFEAMMARPAVREVLTHHS
jgi:glutathione S-transferase